jgi:hypothetical protein
MMRSTSFARLGSEFDNFLFATIGEDRNGTPLSVLSALARLDIDPWQEAARLAKLPEVTAAQRLVTLISGLPEAVVSHADPSTMAARLIALLRGPASPGSAPDATLGASDVARNQRVIMVCLTILICVAGAQVAVTELQGQAHKAGTSPGTETAPAQVSGQ